MERNFKEVNAELKSLLADVRILESEVVNRDMYHSILIEKWDGMSEIDKYLHVLVSEACSKFGIEEEEAFKRLIEYNEVCKKSGKMTDIPEPEDEEEDEPEEEEEQEEEEEPEEEEEEEEEPEEEEEEEPEDMSRTEKAEFEWLAKAMDNKFEEGYFNYLSRKQ